MLLSIQVRSQVIYDTDDDNELQASVNLTLAADPVVQSTDWMKVAKYVIPRGHSATSSGGGALDCDRPTRACPSDEPASCEIPCMNSINPYAHFGQPTLWPRGQPLQCISALSTPIRYLPSASDRVPAEAAIPYESQSAQAEDLQIVFPPAVLQSVVDGDPDVDAIFRLTRRAAGHRIDVRFDSSRLPLLLPAGRTAPWNSQATIQGRDAFFTFVLPAATSFRVTDIWRAYAA